MFLEWDFRICIYHYRNTTYKLFSINYQLINTFFTLILGALLFKVPIKKEKTSGVVIWLNGEVILVTSNGIDFGNPQLLYAFFVVAATTICYAVSVNTIKNTLPFKNKLLPLKLVDKHIVAQQSS